MGPSEEAGKVATSFIDALKTQPATLALIVANLAMLGFLFYALAGAADFRQQMISQQYEYQKHVAELLARCVIPGTGSRGDLGAEPPKPPLPTTPEPPKLTLDEIGRAVR
jgi:hypothetical protein